MKVDVHGTVRVIATPAKLNGSVSTWLASEAKLAAAAGQTLVVDMSATIRAEADGLGGLLEARRILLAQGLWIWLTGMSNPVRRVLQFSAMADLFRIAATAAEAMQYTKSSFSLTSRAGEMAGTVAMLKSPVAEAQVARAS